MTDPGLRLDVAELEVALAEALLADGTAAPGHRLPTPAEIQSGARFTRLDDITRRTAKAVADDQAAVRIATLDALSYGLADKMTLEHAGDALKALADLVDPAGATLKGVTAQADDTAALVKRHLTDALREGADEAYAEARRQGVPDHVLPPLGDHIDAADDALLDAHARRVATAPIARLTKVALDAGTAAASSADAHALDVLGDALDAAEQASTAGDEDVAHQAANVAHGLGRTRAAQAFPPVAQVYASELLDSNTCGPCAKVDGRVYESVDEALIDYPGAGGYIGCDGGARCRGTLVFIHVTEDRPQVQGTKDGRPLNPTPMKATRATPPAHVDEFGRIIPPTPADWADIPLPDDAPDDYIDRLTEGVTKPVEAPTVDVETDTPTVELDPTFADHSDADLKAALDSAYEDGSDEALAYAEDVAREIDARAALGHKVEAVVAEDADPEEVRAVVKAKPAGRKRDRVRADWELHVYNEFERAETECNGYLVRKDALEEFRAKGGDTFATLFTGPADRAYYYASDELREYWRHHPRLTADEFAAQNGITDKKTLDRAAKAKLARQEAEARAEEATTAEKRAARRAEQQQAAAARRKARGPLTEGDKLRREQDRRARLAKAQARIASDTPDVPTPPTPPPPAPAPVEPPATESLEDLLKRMAQAATDSPTPATPSRPARFLHTLTQNTEGTTADVPPYTPPSHTPPIPGLAGKARTTAPVPHPDEALPTAAADVNPYAMAPVAPDSPAGQALIAAADVHTEGDVAWAVAGANPGLDLTPSYSSNCPLATLATELRLRGLDVIAKPTANGVEIGTVRSWLKGGGELIRGAHNTTQAAAAIEALEDGARGFISIDWKDGRGHILNWIKGSDGRAYFIDGQTATVWDVDFLAANTVDYANTAGTRFPRALSVIRVDKSEIKNLAGVDLPRPAQ